jgi:hypothetical protein
MSRGSESNHSSFALVGLKLVVAVRNLRSLN